MIEDLEEEKYIQTNIQAPKKQLINREDAQLINNWTKQDEYKFIKTKNASQKLMPQSFMNLLEAVQEGK